MDVHDKINDMLLDIEEQEQKIAQLKQEIAELKKQGPTTHPQILAKKLEISDLELDIISSQEACTRNAKGLILKDLTEKKDSEQFLEHTYLSACYARYHDLQRQFEMDTNLNLKLQIMTANKQVGTKEYQDLKKEIADHENSILRAQQALDDAIQLYVRQGGQQGANIDFNVPYTDILTEYEMGEQDVDLVQYSYDMSQLSDDIDSKFLESDDPEKTIAQITQESIDIFSNGLNGTSKELAGVYGEAFGAPTFEPFRIAEEALGTSIPKSPEEIIKRDDNKYILVYADNQGHYVGIACSRNENSGELEVIGNGDAVIDNDQLSRIQKWKDDKDKITFDQMEVQVVRHNIENSMKNGKITEIVQVTDPQMLQYISQQNNLTKYSNNPTPPKVYMVSRQDEEGNSFYEFVAHNGSHGYMKLDGLQQVPNTQKSILVDGPTVPGQPVLAQNVDCTFMDNDGNPYYVYHQFGNGSMALSHGEKGKNEINTVRATKDSGLNQMLHNSRVMSLIRAGYNAMGIGYDMVKSIYSKFKDNTKIQSQEQEGKEQE